jgi:hypothetical protein
MQETCVSLSAPMNLTSWTGHVTEQLHVASALHANTGFKLYAGDKEDDCACTEVQARCRDH